MIDLKLGVVCLRFYLYLFHLNLFRSLIVYLFIGLFGLSVNLSLFIIYIYLSLTHTRKLLSVRLPSEEGLYQ